MVTDIQIWKPVTFSKKWAEADTIRFDEIAPSWYRKRKILKENSKEYSDFLTQIKRQHAIETGIIEQLYDLKDGVTETLIKEGFIESLLQHGDTDIPEKKLFDYLRDHFNAIEFVFDVVKEDSRPLSKGYILELHQLITQHQDTCDAIDSLGQPVQVKLMKGAFKKLPNNPSNVSDGTNFLYCPPEQVDSEIEELLNIYQRQSQQHISPIVLAAWFHHAFTTIHPFQDGNGRMARLLATLLLIKSGLFPLTVRRNDKRQYIDGLRAADNEEPQLTVAFFSETQRKNIESVLNLKLEEAFENGSIGDVADLFVKKVNNWKESHHRKRQQRIDENRTWVFECCKNALNKVYQILETKIPHDTVHLYIDSSQPEEPNYHYFSHQIVKYASTYKYYYNRSMPRGWFRLKFTLPENRNYQVIITIHHFGYDDATIAIGIILQFVEPMTEESLKEGERERNVSVLPLDIPPHTLSLEIENISKFEPGIVKYLEETLSLSLAHIINEIG